MCNFEMHYITTSSDRYFSRPITFLDTTHCAILFTGSLALFPWDNIFQRKYLSYR